MLFDALCLFIGFVIGVVFTFWLVVYVDDYMMESAYDLDEVPPRNYGGSE